MIDLNYSVFYKNNTCDDVKGYGTLDYFDEPININNTIIYVNNLVFGDNDGIVVIPKDIEEQVLEKCKKIIENETNISNSIVCGKSINEIINNFGTF